MTDKRATSIRVEPERDPRLARAIQAVEGPAPSAARLELLRARIAAAARVTVESHRERAWWEWMTRWARTEVALAAAAAVLATVVSGTTIIGRGEITIDTTIAVTGASTQPFSRPRLDSVVTRALAVGASSEQVMNAIVGPASGEWLLTAAVARQ